MRFAPGFSDRLLVVVVSAIVFVVSAIPLAAQQRVGIRIDEVLAANRLTSFDADIDSSDWIEIASSEPLRISLRGFSLTDDVGLPRKWVFPEHASVAPGARLVVWCSGKNRSGVDEDEELHTNFRLNRAGEAVFLFDPSGELVDVVTFGPQTEDNSYGRMSGADGFFYFARPTPGGANEGPVSLEPIPSRPEVSPAAGFVSFPIEVSTPTVFPPNVELRFTLDGSEPNVDGEQMDGPIVLERPAVLRLAGFWGRERVTQVTTRTYLSAEENAELELPFMSISMHPRDFEHVHLANGNRGRAFERRGHFEIFDADGELVVESEMGLRLHGGAGRFGDLDSKKSYRTYFRGLYGAKKLVAPLFSEASERFDKLVLRANSMDAFRGGGRATLVRDQVVRDLHAAMGGLVSRGTWYNVFVNTEYRGLYNVTERLDADFMAQHFAGDGDGGDGGGGAREADWDVLGTSSIARDGDDVTWRAMIERLDDSDLSDDAVFDSTTADIDLDNYTSYIIAEVWAQNHDWPSNNWIAARPRRPDGQWRFFVWDAEAGLGLSPEGYETDSFTHLAATGRPSELQTIFISLMENRGYQKYFLEEFDRHLAESLAPERVLELVASHATSIAPDIAEEAARNRGTLRSWEAGIEAVERFASNRGRVLRQFVLRSTILTMPRVVSVDPDRVTLTGEADVEMTGRSLTPGLRVFLDDIESPNVEWISSLRMRVRLPFHVDIDGMPAITVVSEDSSVTTRDVLEVSFPRPVLVNLQPASGSEEGGDEVLIAGVNFLDGVQVMFGDAPSPRVERFLDTTVLLTAVSPPGTGVVPVRVINMLPRELPSEMTLPFTYVRPSPPPLFRRGDANGDGSVNLTDAIVVLDVLFRGLSLDSCDDALDADDSGAINLTDAIVLLDYLFRAPSPAPAPPFEACGADPTRDGLRCGRPTCVE